MCVRQCRRLSDSALLHLLDTITVRHRTVTADLVEVIAVDERRLYLPAGYASMHAYCVGHLHLSEDEAYKRICAARAAQDFPALLTALAKGRLHLTAICLLASHLTPDNADELVAAATHRTKSEIERLLADRFPQSGAASGARPISTAATTTDAAESLVPVAPAQVEVNTRAAALELVPEPVAARPARLTPVSPEHTDLYVRIRRETEDKLRYVRDLLGHSVAPGDFAEVLNRALDLAIRHLEKQKFAAASRPRRTRRCPEAGERHIPAAVKRAVWQRDGGQCTFVGTGGHRCTERRGLEYDHVDPVSLGGKATVDRMRLRCRPHNQYEAEHAFGAEFMQEKRDAARQAAAEKREQATAAEKRAREKVTEQTRDLLAGLRGLGFRADEAQRAAEYTETLHDASLEEKMRAALAFTRQALRARTVEPAA